jgi:NitT/TauT family transport system substrate-binding protein
MQVIQSRRDFLASLSAASAAGVLGARTSLADEGPPETTTIRIRREVIGGVADNPLCVAPPYVAEDLLHAEGFTDIRYVPVRSGLPLTQALATGEINFSMMFAPGAVRRLDDGVPIMVLAGSHPGCFELFAHGHIRTVADLRGKQVGIPEALGGAAQLYVAIMAAHVGLDPKKDIKWIALDEVAKPMELFVQGKIDAYLAFVPEPQELRARKIGRVIVDMAMDQPWSHYFCCMWAGNDFCCMWAGNADFVRKHPVATKRALRAILKATDLCAAEPERAARRLVEDGFARRYDHALQTLTAIPWAVWSDYDPEDSLRFYALWLHEFGELDATPNKIIAEGTDWRFLNELKRKLKA